MENRKLIVNINFERRGIDKELKEELKKNHKEINYHLEKIEERMGYIDDLMVWEEIDLLDEFFESEDWL